MSKMKYQVKVSIVLPTFNRGYTIWKTIQSIISQTYSNWELIIVDDNSTDETSKVVSEFSPDPRITFISNIYKKGVSGARQTGVDASEGEYIGYIDSDNTASSNWLEVIVNRINISPNITFFVPDRNFQMLNVKDNKYEIIIESSQYETLPSIEALWKHDFEGDPNGLVHINKKGIAKWDENLTIYEDYDFFLQLASSPFASMKYIPQALINYFRKYGGDGICSTTTYDDLIRSLVYIQNKYKQNENWEKLSRIPEKIERYRKMNDANYTPLQRLLEKYSNS